jgi:hypothetical protein
MRPCGDACVGPGVGYDAAMAQKRRFTALLDRRFAARLRGRDAETGRFIKLSTARRRKRTSVVERIPLPRPRKRRK